MPLTEDQRQLLDQPNFAHIATLMPDGSPQVTPVWIERDGDDIIVNTAEQRVKTDNVRRDPRVAISLVDAADPYTHLAIRGEVIEVTHEGGSEGIDRLSNKYLGNDYPWHQPDIPRVVLRIRPIHASVQ